MPRANHSYEEKRIFMRRVSFVLAVLLGFVGIALATIFGSVRGIVHDPQHRPVPGTQIVLKAKTSDFTMTVQTDSNGEFHIDAVPLGQYTVTITPSDASFMPEEQSLAVLSGAAPILHFELHLRTQDQSITVSADAPSAQTELVTPTELVDRTEIQQTPGAARSNSLAMITNYVPGAYLTHDQLHVRGGHQVSWLIDGVPIPNTNIASNLGPQIDPKDIDTVEMQRGSYAADFGDRTYGVFNVAPRTGFERNNEAELVASFGNFYQTDNQFNLGGHTKRLAYYGSVNGNRTDLGLEMPTSSVIHDRANGYGGFGSLIYNADPADQLRLVTSLRRDYYQIPFDPNDSNNSPGEQLHDANRESDAFVTFSWVRTFNAGLMLTVSPFYHFNRAAFESSPQDFPLATTDDRSSKYEGGQAMLAYLKGKNNARVGIYGFRHQDHQLFALKFNDPGDRNFGNDFRDIENVFGGLIALFAEDQFRMTSWLTLNAGLRQTHFSGSLVENATSPRFGAALRVPRLHWVFRGFYGHFYQAPPLITASGPLLQFVTSQSLSFIPLHGERDEESQFGVTIPLKSWTLDADTFHTRAKNFFDHSSVGNSDIFFPLTIDGALIRGWELTLRSPRLFKRGQVYLTYSNQVANGFGGINGGLTDFSPPEGSFTLDHDQRNTLHFGGVVNLPWRSYASTDVYYASGFSNGAQTPTMPGDHLQPHTTFDLTLAKELGERFSVSVSGLNMANRRVLLDNSLTFGGTHFLNPRELFAQVRYRFRFR
jgi:TonB dependent receptor/Carboxypeptidase regulatory-like domain/TonB-dependent Receptor Plug Domain